MNKFLIFDADKSLATLGGTDAIRTVCGGITPIPITAGVKQIRSRLEQLFRPVVVQTTHELFSEAIPEIQYEPTKLCQDAGIRGIVIDTLSHSFRQDMRLLEAGNKSGALEMADWGKLERMYNSLMSMLRDLPVWVIVNCHITFDKDQSTGTFYYAPQIKGATKDNIQEYFDVIMFTKASRDGKKIYSWQTFADAAKFGKNRRDLLQPHIMQDFSPVLDIYAKEGMPNPKILVIGESGTGKTKALSTINKG